MTRGAKFVIGGLLIVGALGYLVYTGVSQSVVYFVTPSELQARPVPGKAYRLGGMVNAGSVKWDPPSLSLTFTLSDGKTSVPVRHTGTPPDLFGEGRGAVVEGTWTGDGYFRSSLIMAKHSEEYKAPHDAGPAAYQDVIKTLRGGQDSAGGKPGR